MANFEILNLPNKQTSWDQGKTWSADPNTHFQSGGNWYYLKPGEDIANQSLWKPDTMAGWHRAAPQTAAPSTTAPGTTTTSTATTPDPGTAIDLPTLTSDIFQKSIAGIDWESIPFLQQLSNKIGTFIDAMPTSEQLASQVQGQFSNLMKNALSPRALQGTMNTLARRGILNSKIASDTLSDTASNITQTLGESGYQSVLDAMKAQYALPQVLGDLARTGYTSRSEDPLGPYRLMLQMLS